MSKRLTRDNFDREIREYIEKVHQFRPPKLPDDPVEFFTLLKRFPVNTGPYTNVSIFEAANRVMSDLIVLFAAEKILTEPLPGLKSTHLERVDIALGVEKGYDLQSELPNGQQVIGECFNVARSFFAAKHSSSIRSLSEDKTENIGHRIIAFNSGAVRDAQESSSEWSYIPIDIEKELNRYHRIK